MKKLTTGRWSTQPGSEAIVVIRIDRLVPSKARHARLGPWSLPGFSSGATFRGLSPP